MQTNNKLYEDNASNTIVTLIGGQAANNLTNLSASEILLDKKSTEALENSNLHIKNGHLYR